MVHADRRAGPVLQQWLDEAAATGFLPEEQTLGKFVSSVSTDGLYDTHVFPVCASDQTSFLHGRVHVEVACMTPRSRGAVHISSAAPQAHPHIDHGYLNDTANPDGSSHDLAVLRDGLVHAERLLQHPRLAQVLGERLTDMSTDSAIRDTVTHYYHPVGTCAMGDGPLAVCDADGRVHGVPGVVVADVCLMPQIPRQHQPAGSDDRRTDRAHAVSAAASGGGLGRELAERGIGPRAVDRSWATVHQHRHAHCFGSFLAGRPGLGRTFRVGGDAAVAVLDDADGERDQLLRLHVEGAGGERCVMELAEALVHIGDRVAQLAVQRAQLVEHCFAVTVIGHG